MQTARAYIGQLDAAHVFFPRAIATKVEPLKGFYDAEGYHQDYLVHNPTQPYIVINGHAQGRGAEKGLAAILPARSGAAGEPVKTP